MSVASGTPTAALAATEYTFRATDTDGDTANLTFDITVAAPAANSLSKAGGDGQQGPAGATSPTPPTPGAGPPSP